MENEREADHDPYWDYDDSDAGDCWNCGGEGFVSSCFTEYACMYPDEGCDLCTRRCDVCSPRTKNAETPTPNLSRSSTSQEGSD